MSMINKIKNYWRLPIALLISFTCVTIPLVVNVGGSPGHYQSADGWSRVEAEDGRFSAYFPTKPEFASRQLQIASKNLPYHEYLSGKQGEQVTEPQYSMWRVELPKSWKWAGSKTLLNRSLDVVMALEKAELIEKKAVLHQEYPALAFRLKQADGEKVGRIVLVGSTLYKLMISYPTAPPEGTDSRGFLESLTIYPGE